MAEIINKTFRYENCESDLNIPIIMVTIIEDYYLKEKIKIAFISFALFGQNCSADMAYEMIIDLHKELYQAAINFASINSDKILKLI